MTVLTTSHWGFREAKPSQRIDQTSLQLSESRDKDFPPLDNFVAVVPRKMLPFHLWVDDVIHLIFYFPFQFIKKTPASMTSGIFFMLFTSFSPKVAELLISEFSKWKFSLVIFIASDHIPDHLMTKVPNSWLGTEIARRSAVSRSSNIGIPSRYLIPVQVT